jgi:glycosyltransferase involved in cell wall biosynthesis
MNVSVVIPNWNGRQRLETLLKQLSLQTSPISEVIVVDNGSQDGSAECAEQLGARVIRFGDNRGFSVAVNCGVNACRSELVAILNNDVEPRHDWLERLKAQITPSHVWFATGKLLNSTDESMIDGAFDAICRGACAWRCGQGRADGAVWNTSRELICSAASGVWMSGLNLTWKMWILGYAVRRRDTPEGMFRKPSRYMRAVQLWADGMREPQDRLQETSFC